MLFLCYELLLSRGWNLQDDGSDLGSFAARVVEEGETTS